MLSKNTSLKLPDEKITNLVLAREFANKARSAGATPLMTIRDVVGSDYATEDRDSWPGAEQAIYEGLCDMYELIKGRDIWM